MCKLVSIVYKPQGALSDPDGYTRHALHEAELLAGYGIKDDAKGGAGDRHLNLMAAETLHELAAEGFCVSAGQMGEQLVLTGVPVDSLPSGARLRIGDTACLQIDIPRTGCAKFERHQGKVRQDAAGRLGVMARVVSGGRITVGDPVTLLPAE